jgi:hypothetical protein
MVLLGLPVFRTHLLEVGEHVLPAPARVPQGLPSIVVSPGAAGGDDAVEDAPATNHMSLSIVPGVVVEIILASGGEIPVVGWRKAVADEPRNGDDVGGSISVPPMSAQPSQGQFET